MYSNMFHLTQSHKASPGIIQKLEWMRDNAANIHQMFEFTPDVFTAGLQLPSPTVCLIHDSHTKRLQSLAQDIAFGLKQLLTFNDWYMLL